MCCECYIDGGAYRLKLCWECYNHSFNLWRKVPESDARSVEERLSRCSVEGWRTSDRANITVSAVPATEGWRTSDRANITVSAVPATEGWRTSDRANSTVSAVPATEGGGPMTVPTSRSLHAVSATEGWRTSDRANITVSACCTSH